LALKTIKRSLVRAQRVLAPNVNAALLCVGHARLDTLADQFPLAFRDPCHHPEVHVEHAVPKLAKLYILHKL
jgi:hypothetical protein